MNYTPPPRGEGALNFLGGGVRPRFPKCGACKLIIASEMGGLVNWKNLKFRGLRANFWVKIEVVEAKISHFFFQKGACELTIAWNGTLVN